MEGGKNHHFPQADVQHLGTDGYVEVNLSLVVARECNIAINVNIHLEYVYLIISYNIHLYKLCKKCLDV
jgi:hypothetical protein